LNVRKYVITVKEALTRVIKIKAESEDDALKKVMELF